MAPQVVHHVPFSAEALSAGLGALVGSMVGVDAHMDRQVVPVVKGLATGGNGADEVCPAPVIRHVIFEVLTTLEHLVAQLIGAPVVVRGGRVQHDVLTRVELDALLHLVGIEWLGTTLELLNDNRLHLALLL